jgi:hypothetical protein
MGSFHKVGERNHVNAGAANNFLPLAHRILSTIGLNPLPKQSQTHIYIPGAAYYSRLADARSQP